MSTPTYTIFSFVGNEGDTVDLSPFFGFPLVADPTLTNIGWQLIVSDDNVLEWSGDVLALGILDQGSAPSNYKFKGTSSCNSYLLLQVQFIPDPDQPTDCPHDKSGSRSGPASDSTPNSVELATGRFVFQQDLMSLLGLGSGGWSFDLNYKSNFAIDGILGKGFAYPQYMHLEPTLGSFVWPYYDVQLVTSNLTRVRYTTNADGRTFSSAEGNSSGARLSIVNEFLITERMMLTAADGTVTTFYGFSYDFNPFPDHDPVYQPFAGLIESMVDRYGNRQDFSWGSAADGTPQLLAVTDGFGRQISYTYWGAEGGYRLRRITDYLGRQLDFQYDDQDHLVAAVTPSILKAAPGNTFPGGTAYVFQYDTTNADPARRDDLIKIWYPNQTQPYLGDETRTVDVAAVYASATPRYKITYGQSPNDPNTYGKVTSETLGDPVNEVGGSATFAYTTADLPENIIDDSEAGTIVNRTIYNDRNGNRKIYDFNAFWTTSRLEVQLNRTKSSLEVAYASSYVTWTKFNAQNQPLVVVYPEGNSVQYTYEDGMIPSLPSPFFLAARRGLLLSESRLPGNSIGIDSRPGSNGQTILTRRYFHEPIYNQLCATIEERGNPIDGSSTYFTPQNGGTTPTNSDRSRYATIYTFDYQKDTAITVRTDTHIQAYLDLDYNHVGDLITLVDNQMKATDGTGGIPAGFAMGLGDINGDGTGNGASSGLPNATHIGNRVRITHPSVRLVGGATQARVELFTVNLRGQDTTATDPEGNLTITTRYPENDPEGNGQNISTTLSTQQYGLVREIHRDANPDDVMSLVGASGDLLDFVPGLITRTNTPGVYLDLVTRYEGSSGCLACSYDPMGNVLNETDPRGFTTIYDRNEMGEVYRVTKPAPYDFRVETSYDANRNVIQVDTEDFQVKYDSFDPTSADYGKFTPTGSGTTAHVPMVPGPGGALRPGWFSNLMAYDILDNKIEEDIDATGSTPSHLVSSYRYDANNNLIKVTKPAGNTVEYDYDERDLRILQRIGYDAATSQPGAVTAYSYDGNRNLINVIAPVDHNAGDSEAETSLTADTLNAFGSGYVLTHTGDWKLENTYDGFDRVITTTDAIGNVGNLTYDPTSTLIQQQLEGPIGGDSPTDRDGTDNHPLSNKITRFDEAMRAYEQQQDVFLASTATVPSGRAVTHTGGGLAANSTANDHTGTVTLTTGGSSYLLIRSIFDRADRIGAIVTDNTAQTSYAYDGAGRQILATDPLSNITERQFDGNGNPVRTTRTEVCTITTAEENEVFLSFTWFDCLNRAVISGTQGADGELTDDLALCCNWQGLPSTLFSLTGYDSRGNKTTEIDPKLNVLLSLYDGASRLFETQQEMRLNGDGRKAPAPNQTFLTSGGGVIRTEYLWDANGRMAELVDDRGSSTVFAYDLLDRQVTKTLADGSSSTRVYDQANCQIGFTDENGSVFTMAFDAAERKTGTAITRATGVGGTTAQSFQYDGLSRQTFTSDTNPSGTAEVSFCHDSSNRLLEETQAYDSHTRYTTHTKWLSFLATEVTYPTTGVTASSGYDLLYRRISLEGDSLTDGTLEVVTWDFFGPTRIVETNYADGSLIATQMNNSRTRSARQAGQTSPAWGNVSSDRLGYDGAGRMLTKRYLTGGIDGSTHAYNDATALVGFTTEYDRASNKLYERHLHAESRSHLYQPFNSDGNFAIGYDSASRLRQYQRGILSTSTIPYRVNPGSSVTTPITLPGTDQTRSYDLDGLGNWKKTNYALVGSGGDPTDTAEIRQHNYVNEITSIKKTDEGSPVVTPFSYDHGNNTDGIKGNGNLTNDGVLIYAWDAFNRLIQIKNASTNAVLASYHYDALNRRIWKTINDLGGGNGGITGDIPAGTTVYLYDGQQIVEERDDAAPDDASKVFFWGQYIDELMFFNVPGGATYRVLSDLLYRSVASVGTDNEIIEAYDTDAYGNTLCYSGPGTDGNWFTDDDVLTNNPINSTIFTGRQYDPESQIYYYRARYYCPTIGRFITRDPIGEFGGPNLYEFIWGNSVNFSDPTGFITKLELLGIALSLLEYALNVAEKPLQDAAAGSKCRETCDSYCTTLKIVSMAALTASAAGVVAAIIAATWETIVGPLLAGGAVAAAVLILGKKVDDDTDACHNNCKNKPSTKPPACCEE